MTDNPQAATEPVDPFTAFFSYRGRIGRTQYFVAMGIAIAVLFGALASVAGMMNPTGGGTPALLLLIIPAYFWIHSLATIKRLRDAGLPTWHYLIYAIGPFVWLALTLELIEAMWVIMLIGFAVFYIVPGVLRPKEMIEPAAT